jgi:hypothetical protein
MPILEVSEDGSLHIPNEMLGGVGPHAQVEVEHIGDITLLRPTEVRLPPVGNSSAAKADALRSWAELPRPNAPDLPAQALRREYLYE